LDLFTLGFGAIVGVGWIIIMGDWLASAGPIGTILALLVGAAAMAVIGLSYVEMASLLPVAGGEIVYGYEAFGAKAGFAAGWIIALVYVTGAAFEAIAVGWIVSVLLPALEGPVVYALLGSEVRLGPLLLGVAGNIALAAINYRSVKSTASFQNIATAALVILTAIFLIAAFIAGDARNMRPLFVYTETGSILPGFLTVLATVPFFFIGFNIIPQALGERAPGEGPRTIRRTILLAIAASCFFYCAIVVAATLLAPRADMVGVELPVYAAAVAAFDSPLAGQAVLIAGLLGLLTTWNAVFFASTRVLLALARSRMIPEVFSRVHPRFRTPTAATVLVAVMSVLGTCLGRGAILPIVNALGAATTLVFAMVCFGVIRLRSAQARPLSPKTAYIIPLLGGVLSLILCIVALYQAYLSSKASIPTEWVLLLVWAVLGIVFWWLARNYRGALPASDRRAMLLSDLQQDVS
jgi:amino acid transporter